MPPPEPYATQVAVGRSITTVICVNYVLHHLPHHGYRQLIDGEPLLNPEWEISLPALPQKFRAAKRHPASEVARWVDSWNTRGEQLMEAHTPQTPNPNPSQSDQSGGGSFPTLGHISSPSYQPGGSFFTTMDHNDFMLGDNDGYEMQLNFDVVYGECTFRYFL